MFDSVMKAVLIVGGLYVLVHLILWGLRGFTVIGT